MAFVSRIGNILKQAGSKHINIETSASSLSLYQAVRCMPSAELFIGARIIMDRETGRSRFFSKISRNRKSSPSSLEILSYMGGLDGEQKQLIKKLVNFRMKEGKKTRVRAIVYQTFHRLARTEGDVIKLMVDALENIKPICEVVRVGIAGNIYDVPGIVARDRQQTLAIRWILDAAFKRRISYRISSEKCLFDEILDAYRKRGIACKKRENLHRLATTNRSFAHFRWW